MDKLTGNDGADSIVGGEGADVIAGGEGADIIAGGDDADVITGGADDDTITSGEGADDITAGAGNDKITGGVDADQFVGGGVGVSTVASASSLTSTMAAEDTLTFGNGVDIITDFHAASNDSNLLHNSDAFAAFTDSTIAASLTNIAAGSTTAATALDSTNGAYIAFGTFVESTGVFTMASAFDATTDHDAIVGFGKASSSLTTATFTGWTVLQDLSAAVVAADLIYT